MGREPSSELAGPNVGVEQVVGRRSPESLVIESQLTVSHVEVVEVAALAALSQRSELGCDQLDGRERQEVGATGPPVGVRREGAAIECLGCRNLIEVDLDLDPTRSPPRLV